MGTYQKIKIMCCTALYLEEFEEVNPRQEKEIESRHGRCQVQRSTVYYCTICTARCRKCLHPP